jgi:UDP-N-acetylglucosamine 2-epimerase
MKRVLTIIGTRPEAIKLAPVLTVLNDSKLLESKVCFSWQHQALLDGCITTLHIKPDFELAQSQEALSLPQSAARIIDQFSDVLKKAKPVAVVIQGDTTTAFSAALAAYYAHIPVAHIESGLRTDHIYAPWPEEGHRRLISSLTTYFFAPSERARLNLYSQGVDRKKVWVVGNTSIDAIRLLGPSLSLQQNSVKKSIVVTIHRRENQGGTLEVICLAIKRLAQEFKEIEFKWLVHPNPSVQKPIFRLLTGLPNICLLQPVNHSAFVQLLYACEFIITDSGGIQEEAPFIGKPIVVVRDTTERPEGVLAGTARLVGIKANGIIEFCRELLQNPRLHQQMSRKHFPYGDGYAAHKIVKILEKELA